MSTFSLGCGHHPARLHTFGHSCPHQDYTHTPAVRRLLGLFGGSLSRHEMRSSHLVLTLHIHQSLPPDCGRGTLLCGAGTWRGSDSEVTLETSIGQPCVLRADLGCLSAQSCPLCLAGLYLCSGVGSCIWQTCWSSLLPFRLGLCALRGIDPIGM